MLSLYQAVILDQRLILNANMSLTVQELQHAWLQYDKFEHTRKELQQLDEKELRARMEPRIDFGTAGLRAKMAAGFACMNELVIIQTTQV